MKNKYKKRNPKVIALIIEIVLLVVGTIAALIFEGVGKPLYWVPVAIVAGILIFSLILTLSLIRYDAVRDIRADGSFKQTNLPLYTDQTTLICHDIIEEKDKD